MAEKGEAMNLKKLTKFAAALAIVLAAGIAAQIIHIGKLNKKPIVSFYSEWRSNGVPVDICKIKKSDFKVWRRITLSRIGDGIMQGFVPQGLWAHVRVGQEALIEVDDKSYPAKVSSVGQGRNIDTGLYEIRLFASNGSLPNLPFYHAKINTEILQDSVAFPIDAVAYNGGAPTAWIVEKDVAKKIYLDVRYSDGLFVVLDDGKFEGVFLVVRGCENLSAGDKLLVNETKPDCAVME